MQHAVPFKNGFALPVKMPDFPLSEVNKYIHSFQACDFSGFYFTSLPLPQNILERREVASMERKK